MPSIRDLKIKVRAELPDLVKAVKASGFEARIVRNGTIITLKQDYGRTTGNRQVFLMPYDVLKGHSLSLSIDTTESGGGASNTGRCHLVCGMTGKALKPFLVPTSGHLSNGVHAHFCVFEKFVSVDCSYSRGITEVQINNVIAKFEGNDAVIDTETVWEGNPEFLPISLGQFQAVVDAAAKKVHSYHCRNAFFIAGKE